MRNKTKPYRKMLREMGERVRSCRNKKGEYQSKVARKIGISKTQLSMYERGLNDPGVYRITRIADYFGVTTDWLLGLTNLGSTV